MQKIIYYWAENSFSLFQTVFITKLRNPDGRMTQRTLTIAITRFCETTRINRFANTFWKCLCPERVANNEAGVWRWLNPGLWTVHSVHRWQKINPSQGHDGRGNMKVVFYHRAFVVTCHHSGLTSQNEPEFNPEATREIWHSKFLFWHWNSKI